LATYNFTDTKSLAKGFKLADQNPTIFIAALNDPTENVQVNAQRFIRYLADPKAMAALRASQSGQKFFTGAVPVPLEDWDYERIQNGLLCDSCSLKSPDVNYIYALVLDGSQRAQELLGRINARYPRKVTYGERPESRVSGNVEKQLVRQAFFISADDKKFTKAQRIAINRRGDKALYVVYVNRGPLAEEWYHVVMTRESDGWRIISVSFAANS